MKLMKYTFRTPLYGSIEAEELLSDTDGRIELSPEQMCRLYDQGPELLLHLSESAGDLAFAVPAELEDVVLRADFGDCAMLGGKMYLRTYVWVEGNLTETGIQQIKDWISGQMSDGWGEGLEQRAWRTDRVHKPVMYFDEYSLEFDTDEELCEVNYYVNPWNSDDFCVYLDDCESVEEDAKFEVVATMALPYHSRQVVKLRNGFAVKAFLKDFGLGLEFAHEIEDSFRMPQFFVYLVRDLDGDSGVEILHKWVCESGACCVFNDGTLEDELHGTQMPVSKAILELLK